MLLTQKGFRKILIMAICYFSLGTLCNIFAVAFHGLGISAKPLFILGIIVYILCVLVVLWGRYAEGKGKLIASGNKLVRNELKPAEFIKEYEALRNSDGLVIHKPQIDVLMLAITAYDSLNEPEKALEVADEMIEVAPSKKKVFALLVKSSILFSCGRTEEAEQLFIEAGKQKQSVLSSTFADAVMKSDRAIAMGDLTIAEAYYLGALERTFPKPDNLGILVSRYKLGEIYEKQGDAAKAVPHYEYCAKNGGETAIRADAAEKIAQLTKE